MVLEFTDIISRMNDGLHALGLEGPGFRIQAWKVDDLIKFFLLFLRSPRPLESSRAFMQIRHS